MKNILLIIDVQKGFIINEAVTLTKNNIDGLLSLGCFDCVISTVYQNYENSPIIKLMGWNKLLEDDEQQLTGKVQHHSDYVVKKTTYSAVNAELLDTLKGICDGNLPEYVFVVGVDTECCVLATATDLFELGIRPIVLTKYCGASSGAEYHKAGLLSMQSLIGKCNMFNGEITSSLDLERAYAIAIENTTSGNVDEAFVERDVVDLLIGKGWHISFAESCTGGLAVAKIVSVPDASKVLNASHVTYANAAKIDYLDVRTSSIEQYGVVSEQVAKEMAIGVAKRNNAEVGVGISGIAGPGGATEKKPVGMVCFGFYVNGITYTYTMRFGNIGRNNVRDASVDFVYETLRNLLNN